MSDRSNAQIIAEALREEGLDTGGFSPHSWRCEHPDRYPGYCTCVEDAVTHIVAALEAEGRLTPAVQGDAKLLQNSDEREALAKLLYESAPEGGRQGIEWHEWEAMEAESGHTFVRDSYRKQADAILAAGWRRG